MADDAAAETAVAPSIAEDAVVVEEKKPEDEPGEEGKGEEEMVAPLPPLTGMVILPPRQKDEVSANEFSLALPPIRPEEPVQSLRLALSEVVGLAHYTNYRLEVEHLVEESATDGSTKPTVKELPLVSPFSGKTVVVSMPAALKSLNHAPVANVDEKTQPTSGVLDEFADLQSTAGVQDGAGLRMVLERYDAASIKEHILRLRHILDGNAPYVVSLVDDTSADSRVPAESGEDPEKKEESSEEEAEKESEKLKSLCELPLISDARVNGANLKDFFYLCAGEDPVAFSEGGAPKGTKEQSVSGKSKKKKRSDQAKHKINASSIAKDVAAEPYEDTLNTQLPPAIVREKLKRLNQLEDSVHVPCTIQYSGFHPPPSARRMMGDIAYLEVSIQSKDGSLSVFQVTASTLGFYLNRTTVNGRRVFDPSPAPKAFYSHTLLDCLLQASESFTGMWKAALDAAKERGEISAQINKGSFSTLFRLAIRGDMGGYSDPVMAMRSSIALDSTLGCPSWLVSMPKSDNMGENTWNRNVFHGFSSARAEDDLSQTFGVDVRNGALRDWNEELQLAREMPTSTLFERLERARVIHKTMTEFGEASLMGVKAICDGHIAPMNPNEGTRTQVYLHNNIFVSRALDVGPETFRLVKGDKAAKKSASREIHCIKTFHRMEGSGFHTLATVLIDYLGSRFICQSILPGILQGEKSHTILLGSVDIEIPMKCDEDFQKLLREKIGDPLNLLDRPVFTSPLTKDRREECKKMKRASLMLAGLGADAPGDVEIDQHETIVTCAPLETKGIRGSDQRKYLLDFSRMTPRDANWVSQQKGGTGKWESVKEQNGASHGMIPSTLEDEEWTMSVLRPELINQWIRSAVSKHIEQKRKEVLEAAAKKKAAKEANESKGGEDAKEDEEEDKFTMTEDEQKTLTDSLRLNVNTFLPDVRVVDPEQMKQDEDKVREASSFLWDEVLPRVTRAVREKSLSQLPVDGKALTEFLHRNGINCRYLGRLAVLAREEEERDNKTNEDLKNGRLTVFSRRTMPSSWLELIECEMVARAAKHVMDAYLMEDGGAAAARPAQLIASFLSAIVSEREETAAQTETRIEKQGDSVPDEDDVQALTVVDVGGSGDAIPAPARTRHDIWKDIEAEIGRRFRYNLVLFNKGNKSGRAIHVPLLRRVCQRTGVRLLAKNYDVGGRCYTEGNTAGGRLAASHPISPLDIFDVLPLMKHTAAYYEGFSPCSLSPALATPPLQISLYDARMALERAHLQMSGRGLSRALELAQEAASLYQRVTENGAHPAVVECVELMGNVFLEANDTALAVDNGAKALGLAVQSGGFDGPSVFHMHILMFQMMFAARYFDQCVKHLRAAMFLLEISAGPRHSDHYDALHKLGAVYSFEEYQGKYSAIAVKIFRELEHLNPNDRLLEGFTLRALAKSLAECGDYKDAVEVEKRANKSLSRFVGKDHEAMKESDSDLLRYTKLAVEEGNRSETMKTNQEKELAANALAETLLAEEDSKKKKQNKKKKGKK